MEVGTDRVAPLSKHNTIKAYGMRLGEAAEIRDVDNRCNRFHYPAAISPRKRVLVFIAQKAGGPRYIENRTSIGRLGGSQSRSLESPRSGLHAVSSGIILNI
jgi:hypothetical protein